MVSDHTKSRYLSAVGLIAVLGILPHSTRSQRIPEVLIGGTEYAFLGVPASLASGPTVFRFQNRGRMPHMVIIARLRDGVTPDSVLHTPPYAQGGLFEGGEGALVAAPGEAAVDQLTVPLAPGATYVLFCLARNGPRQPAHITLGMFASFRVE